MPTYAARATSALDLGSEPRGQGTDNQADREHDGKGDHVLRVGDGESMERRDEKKIEHQHGQ